MVARVTRAGSTASSGAPVAGARLTVHAEGANLDVGGPRETVTAMTDQHGEATVGVAPLSHSVELTFEATSPATSPAVTTSAGATTSPDAADPPRGAPARGAASYRWFPVHFGSIRAAGSERAPPCRAGAARHRLCEPSTARGRPGAARFRCRPTPVVSPRERSRSLVSPPRVNAAWITLSSDPRVPAPGPLDGPLPCGRTRSPCDRSAPFAIGWCSMGSPRPKSATPLGASGRVYFRRSR